MGDVFISYKQDERERMRPIADGLRALGVDVWFDERLQPDRSFTEEIQDVMNGCRAQIVCWSPAAVASEWVRGEAEVARQRGVLVAVMIEPCALPPPFNMHHAENLSGWHGDARHAGWRKVCETIGRKLGREGLGDLAALQASDDAAAWKKWAQRFPNDPLTDAAWSKAEELEIGAARARMARDRDAAKQGAEEAERSRAAKAAVTPPPATTPLPPPVKTTGRMNPVIVGGIVLALTAAGAGTYLFWPRGGDQASSLPTTTFETPVEVAEQEATTDPAAGAATTAAPSTTAVSTPPPPPPDLAAGAMRRIRALTNEEWYNINVYAMGVLREPGVVEALQRSANASDPRVLTVLAYGYAEGYGGAPRNSDEANRLFQRAAEQGFAPAQNTLAVSYLNRDRRESVRWWRAAADQGHPAAQQSLAFALASGDGVAVNRAEAIRYFRLAARHPSGSLSRDWLSRAGETW
ncbi:MAG: toll/interleukin-1 receptor domain-containing protein [Hyphomonadaceae bacterium]